MKLTIELPDDELTALQARAEQHGVSTEAYARQVLERDLKSARRMPRHVSQVLADIVADLPLTARKPLGQDH